jgi:electron transfer flavoprotein alpha subunit
MNSSANTRLPRINPRRPVRITPTGMRRIVLGSYAADGSGDALAPQPGSSLATAKPVRARGPFSHCVLVVAHAQRGTLDGHARQVLALAAILASPQTEVVLAVLGACQDDAGALGADRLLCVAEAGAAQHGPQAGAQWLAQLHAQLNPLVTYLPDRDADADLGRRFASAQRLSLAAHVIAVERGAPSNNPAASAPPKLRVRCHAQQDALRQGAEVVLAAPGVARSDLPFTGLGLAWTPEAVAAGQFAAAPAFLPADELGLQDLGVHAGDARSVALEEADFILAAGNGVTDLALFQQLADALGAATGASRVAVDDGRFPRAKQIGATGKTVQASTYLAVGISGAVQHLQGIKDCRHVLAVNTDAAAPIAKRAALLAVADSHALMRELLALVLAERAARGVQAGAATAVGAAPFVSPSPAGMAV